MEQASIVELKQQWREYFKNEPPLRPSAEFMRGNIAWHQQAKECDGYKRKIKGQIKKLMQQLRDGLEVAPDNALIIKSGTKLIRTYKGSKYEVIATEKGFLYEGRNYTSLSTIASEITGTSWNGKVFFGLKGQKR